MPMYQTKTIAGILEPVAQQVSKLIILHEEGEDGNAMPDLEKPVQAVSTAVNNLVKVGQETINSSQDSKLKYDMPKALDAIAKSASLLEQACKDMKRDPYSKQGRDRLIAGSRGILQGTTAMLVIFDESQVRKLCRDCKKVLDYLAISEVIETMEDLVQFVKDLSPSLSKVCLSVEARRRDLLNPYQRDALGHHLEQLKTLAPILICSMKIFIQIIGQGGKGLEEAVENRNYLSRRMTDEIDDINRILEEPIQEEMTSVSGMNQDTNLSDMSFQELSLKLNHLISTGQNYDQRLIMHLLEISLKIADNFDGHAKSDILDACHDLDNFIRQSGNNQTPEAKRKLQDLVTRLRQKIDTATINRIILDLADIATPLKQFSDVVVSNNASREMADQKAQNLQVFSTKVTKTATIASFASVKNKQKSSSLQHLSDRVQNLAPQLINAGTIRMNYPDNRAAMENFENLKKQYSDGMVNIRDLCDDSVELKVFMKRLEEHIRNAVDACEQAVSQRNPQRFVDNVGLAARLGNRLLMALYKELDNSEDPGLKRQVDSLGEHLKNSIAPFVENGKSISGNLNDQNVVSLWKKSANHLLETVADVIRKFTDLNNFGLEQPVHVLNHFADPSATFPPPIPPPPVFNEAPPRPPLPMENVPPPRPPMPPMPSGPPVPADTDDEEGLFTNEPRSNRPIHLAAHGLYQEVKQWDHSDNELIAAAKKIAYLMAHLSELIRGGRGTKRELIACSKALADASERITELAKELARHCLDKKIRTNLLQVCEKIPTLGTQLRVLSTVKATMMGQNMDSEEDQEAMDMLVFNAQKLNQAVKETVRAAEAASIRVRSDAGFKLKWVRKQPWFQ